VLCVVQVTASAMDWSLDQWSPTECVSVSNCVWARNLNNETA